tara:strand:+ start:612 stop:764 length:153 start_codon:yes stop_codon:yes gene_type:complete
MENKEKEKEIASYQFEKNNDPNDYECLIQNLKSIFESIHLLEKNFLNKET